MMNRDVRMNGLVAGLGRALMIAVIYAVTTPAFAQSAQVTLTFRAGSATVDARFDLSEAVDVLRFAGNGEVRLKSWVPSDGARLNSDGTALLLPTPQKSFSVQLKAFERDGMLDRVYSPVVLFGDGRGAQIYSEYLLPKGGGFVSLATPGVVLGHSFAKGATVWRANDAATYIVAGVGYTKTTTDYDITLDSALPRWVVQSLDQQVKALMHLYTRKFGSRPKRKPWIVVSFNPAGSGFRGDTNPGMVRLNLMGQSWEVENADQSYQLASFLAHELFHLWNAGLWTMQHQEPIWLYEGGADAAAHHALNLSGFSSAERYRNERASSLTGCSSANGVTLANKIAGGGRTHYTCGAAVFYLAAAMGEDNGDAIGALDLWADMFASHQTRSYATADLLRVAAKRALHPASATVATPRRYLDELAESTLPWRDVLAQGQQAFQLHQVKPDEAIPPAVAGKLLDQLVIDRFAHDCDGKISVYDDHQVYQLDALDSCHRIRNTVTLTHLGGYSMRDNAVMAVTYAREQCAKGLDLHFGGKGDVSLDLPCSQMPPVPPGLFVPNLGS